MLDVDIASASAIVRASGPGVAVEQVDVQDKERVWSGVVPTWLVYGNLVASQHNEVAEVPEYIQVVGRPRRMKEKKCTLAM